MLSFEFANAKPSIHPVGDHPTPSTSPAPLNLVRGVLKGQKHSTHAHKAQLRASASGCRRAGLVCQLAVPFAEQAVNAKPKDAAASGFCHAPVRRAVRPCFLCEIGVQLPASRGGP
jgi:hypothetical protein